MVRDDWGLVLVFRLFCAGFAVALLSSCTMDLAVTGVLGENEELAGSVTQYDDGGTIELFGAPGTHCVGSFSYRRMGRDQIGGEGKLICDDRRSGPFSFIMVGRDTGHGSGNLAGVPFRVRFGRSRD